MTDEKRFGIRNTIRQGLPFSGTADEDDEQFKKDIQKKMYVCPKCKYKFTIDPNKFTAIKCPWCGRQI